MFQPARLQKAEYGLRTGKNGARPALAGLADKPIRKEIPCLAERRERAGGEPAIAGKPTKKNPMELKLSIDDFDVSPQEIRAFALQAPNLSPYRLAYFLNKSGYWDFYNTRRVFIPEENPALRFEVFRHDNEIDHVQWFFFGNDRPQQAWIPDLPMAGFFLAAVGAGAEFVDPVPVSALIDNIQDVFLSLHLPIGNSRANTRKNPYFKYFKDFYNFLSLQEMIASWE